MIFPAQSFFDITGFSYKDIFTDAAQVWEVLPKLEAYITSLFASGRVQANYHGQENVYVGEGTIIHEGVRIEGPAIIGDNSIISHGAYLRGGCLFGSNVHVGHGAEVKHSIFLNHAVAAHLNYVGDSIIGNHVNIAGGVMLANFRLDKQEVQVKHKEEVIATGLQKFGAIIGDNGNIGANAVLNPGTLLGKGVVVYPLQLVKGIHHDNTIIR